MSSQEDLLEQTQKSLPASLETILYNVLDMSDELTRNKYEKLDQFKFEIEHIQKALKLNKVENFAHNWNTHIDCEEMGYSLGNTLYWDSAKGLIMYSNDLHADFDDVGYKPVLSMNKEIRVQCSFKLERFLSEFIKDNADNLN